MAFIPLRLAIFCAALSLVLTPATSASAQELLRNGGFEQGATGWSGSGISTSGCTPRSGGTALAVTSFAQQALPSPIGSGAYVLSGWLKARSGPTSANLVLFWLGASGTELKTNSKAVAAGEEYASFSITATAPPGAHGLRVRITGDVCLDDLSLEGPPAPPPATATATSVPTQQSSSALGAKATAQPAATATPRPSATAQPGSQPGAPEAAPSRKFLNGGFEDGLTGWGHFGGELRLVASRARSGSRAAELTSSTDSTKWAYQTVLVEAGQSYEFAGYVGSDAGVASAYLRISWYASADGSGAALSMTDSTEVISGTSGFAYLTTGPVSPQVGARSARVRIVMAPAGSAPTSIVFDDLWFGAVSPAPSPESEPESPPGAEQRAAPNVSRSSRSNAAPAVKAEVTEDTAEARSAAAPAATPGALPSGALPVTRPDDRGIPLIWLAGAGAFVLAIGGSYLQGKRRSG